MKIGFVLLSSPDNPIPSTRVAALNLFPALRAQGHSPEILFGPTAATETPTINLSAAEIAAQGFKVVVFQKVYGPSVRALALELEARGVRTIYLVCDLVEPEMSTVTSATVVVTEFLGSQYPPSLQHKLHVVHDGIERPAVFKTSARPHRGSWVHPLRAVLVTSATLSRLPELQPLPSWLQLRVVGRYPHAVSFERLRLGRWLWAEQPDAPARRALVRFALDPRIRCVPWHPDGVYDELLAADIGVIPVDTGGGLPAHGLPPHWAVKSENRLTLMMAASLPVVATAIPSYLPVVRQGENAILTRTSAEWLAALDALRDPALRQRMGERARESVLESFSVDRQAQRFSDVLRYLIGDQPQPSE